MSSLQDAIAAVFKSWNNDRAILYRQREKISDDIGTAVNIQSMVFGNMGEDCGTGVAFTRNASNGDKEVFGEYLMNAQGEDVVAGVRTPMPIAELAVQNPEIYKQFDDICKRLEDHYKDMQDIEFTIEHNKLFILQCRSGKRTGPAAVKIAVDLVNEGLISKEDGARPRQPRTARPVPAPDHQARRQVRRARQGPARRSRRGDRHRRLRRRAAPPNSARAARASASSWSAPTPRPTTSRACSPPRAS